MAVLAFPDSLRVGLDRLGHWRRLGLLFALGMVSATALPPLGLVPALLPGLVALAWTLEDAPGARQAFGRAWVFGFGHHVVGLAWISEAFLTDPVRLGWMIPIAISGLAALMALYIGLTGLAVRLLRFQGAALPFALAGFWTLFDWVRSWAFTGFPWNPIGSVWTASDALLQSGAWMGVYGLGTVTVLLAAAPAALSQVTFRSWPAWVPLGCGAVVLAVLFGAGTARVNRDGAGFEDGIRLRLVQPNIPQVDKWVPELRAGHVRKQIALSTAPEAKGKPPTHAIWGETMVPFDLAADGNLQRALAAAVPAPQGLVIVGAPRVERDAAGRRSYNSMMALDSLGRLLQSYDKSHLVPFGEYVPFADILPLGPIAIGGGFMPGPGLRTLTLPGLPPVGPLICYEVIFPGRVTAEPRPDWLLNLTNDAWYGTSWGPYQHLAAARWRAVEEGLPLVRVANTGISAIIGPKGDIVEALPLATEGIADGPLPKPLPPTPFARYGLVIPMGIAIWMVVVAMAMGRLESRKNRPRV